MKSIKYISFSLIALIMGILCISFIPINTAFAQSFEYEAQVVEDNTYLPDYALSNIEYCSVSGDLICNLSCTATWLTDLFLITTDYKLPFNKCKNIIVEFDFTSDLYYSNNYGNYFSIFIGSSGDHITIFDNGSYLGICFWDDVIDYEIQFANRNLTMFGQNTYNCNNSDFLLDFNNETNASFDIRSLNNSFWGDFYQIFLNNNYVGNSEPFIIPSRFISSLTFMNSNQTVNIKNQISDFRINKLQFNNNKHKFVCDYYFDFYNLKVGLYRPSYRLNNTLILYNYDYYNGFFSSLSYLEYSLRRGSDIYKIYYGDSSPTSSSSSLPNSTYLCFYNKEVQNVIFDEYITIKCTTRKHVPFSVNEENILYINAGFDFNFVQYNQPLVASNGSFNYTFDKPKYVDMKFSLAPFYIPILEIVENAFIFLMFYCPIISDILEFIHLDMFMGGLINVINFIVGGAVGQFILSCIAFIIFFELLRRFMPVVYSTKNDIVEMYHSSNGYKYRLEKKKAKKEWKYQQYKDKQFAKKVSRIQKKNIKKKY